MRRGRVVLAVILMNVLPAVMTADGTLARTDGKVPGGPNSGAPAPPPKPAATAPDFRGIRGHVLVDAVPTGYRKYVRRSRLVYRPGEEVILYGEPIGFGWTAVAGGQQLHMKINVEIVGQSGEVAFRPAEMEIRRIEPAMPVEPYFHVSFTLPDLKPGEYGVHFNVVDAVTRKRVRFHRPITVPAGRGADKPKG